VCAWIAQRRRENLQFDLPRPVTILLLLYLVVVLVSFVRIIGDTYTLSAYYQAGMTYFFNEYVINTIKWVIPGLLLFDGCRSEERFRLAVLSVLSVFVLLSLQVAKWMPPTYAMDGDALERRSLKVLISGIGYHRVNLSAMLSGASWAILCTTVLFPRGKRWIALVLALFVVYAQMMTGGRAGYAAWVGVGVVMCVLKWRRYLVLIPTAALLGMLVLPGVAGRALEGFTPETHDTNSRLEEQRTREFRGGQESSVDSYTVTAGRSLAWPLVIGKIKEQPLVGYGRQAMLRTGVATYLYETLGEIFPHPHNAYLEILFDSGIIGFAIVMAFHLLMLFYAVRNFLDHESPTCSAIGGIATALILGLLVSAMGSQTFYPREGWTGMWVAMLLNLRARIERQRRKAERTGASTEATEVAAVPVASASIASPARGWKAAEGGMAIRGAAATAAARRGSRVAGAAPVMVRHFRGRTANSTSAAPSAPRERQDTQRITRQGHRSTPAGVGFRGSRGPALDGRAERPILYSGWLNTGVTDPVVWKWA
jgi:O-antigen ligase